MISRRKLDTLVERVYRRIAEAIPAPTSARQGNFRYDASGKAVTDQEPQANPTARTQMPPTQHPPTMPAARSNDEKELAAKGGMGRNPQAAPMSQGSMKVNAIKKALDAQGWTAQHGIGEQELVQSLKTWYATLDPGDALVATADQLAQRWADAEN